MPTLEFSHVNLDIKDGATTRPLLCDISFTATPGEVLAITGPSGSGKSTLLAIAGCLQSATSGGVWLGDTELSASGRTAARLRREKIGIVFQKPNLIPSLTVLEQLLLMPRLGRLWAPRGVGVDKARSLLADVGLSGLENRKVSELSGGQQARVNLARALMNDPELLLIDEPTAALDTAAADQVTDLIIDLVARKGLTALYVTHDLRQIPKFGRTMEVIDGRIREKVTA